MNSWPVAAVVSFAAVLGAVAGALSRLLLARLRRGALLPVGPLEAVTAALAACACLLTVGQPALTLLLCWLSWWGTALAAVDLRHHRLPDALTVPGVGVGIALVLLARQLDAGSGNVLRALACAAVTGGLFAVLAVVAPSAMGWGDVKLVVSLALLTGFVGVATLVLALAGGFVLAAVVALVGVAMRHWTMRSAIAFGPFLIAGSWLALALASGWS